MRIMENKRKTVEEFVVKGERLMEDPKSPKFLETHVSKLKEAWDDAQKKAQERKKALEDSLDSWKIFDTKKVDCSKSLDSADKHFKSIKRIYDLERGPADLADKLKTAAAMRCRVNTPHQTIIIIIILELRLRTCLARFTRLMRSYKFIFLWR